MGLKKKRPGIATAKPTKAVKAAPKYTRTPSVPKVCCGALRGHKPDCTGSAAEDLFDGGPVGPVEDLADVAVEEAAFAANAVVAALRGIEAAIVHLADSVDTIKVIIGSAANSQKVHKEQIEKAVDAAVATPPKIRKAVKPEAAPVAVEPEPEKSTPAPAVKAVTVSLEEVRSAFLAFASRKGRDEAVAILGRFGAPKVGDLPPAQFPAFLSALKGA